MARACGQTWQLSVASAHTFFMTISSGPSRDWKTFSLYWPALIKPSAEEPTPDGKETNKWQTLILTHHTRYNVHMCKSKCALSCDISLYTNGLKYSRHFIKVKDTSSPHASCIFYRVFSYLYRLCGVHPRRVWNVSWTRINLLPARSLKWRLQGQDC